MARKFVNSGLFFKMLPDDETPMEFEGVFRYVNKKYTYDPIACKHFIPSASSTS